MLTCSAGRIPFTSGANKKFFKRAKVKIKERINECGGHAGFYRLETYMSQSGSLAIDLVARIRQTCLIDKESVSGLRRYLSHSL